MDSDEQFTVVDHAIDTLREAIRSGQFEPGSRLVIADIGKRLSISSGAVREAIRRLTGEGLVEIVPHRGASVRKVTGTDVAEIFELREAIEGLAARLAARRMDADGRARLRAILADLDRHDVDDDAENYLIANQAFHQLIYSIAANDRVRTLAMQLILPLYQLRLPHRMAGDAREVAHLEHHAIAATLMVGDEDAAAAAMMRHIRSSGANLRAAVELLEAPRKRRRAPRSAPRQEDTPSPPKDDAQSD
ncbi:GntR family transcriptional regulator [Tsuneonella suprasediminis]|nr:GntR family transcriptional regulator [Tsuneonella suprasediminis]